MSMFDYDARPVTPQVILVGNRASSAGYTIRDFLSRNGVPYDWVDLEDVERLAGVVSPSEMGRMAADASPVTARDKSAWLVRLWRCSQRLDQALRSGHRRGAMSVAL